MPKHKTCGTCVWATQLRDGLHCIDGLYEKDGEKGLWVVVGGPLEEEET